MDYSREFTPPGIHKSPVSFSASQFPQNNRSEMDNMNSKGGPEVDLGSLEGDIVIPGLDGKNESSPGEFNTLDEPILDTINRDVKAIGQKMYAALVPDSTKKSILLKEWDLWGYLVICTYIGLLLQMIESDPSGYVFTQVFALVFIGTTVITYNFVFCFSATISIFQCVCVLGYCLGPLGVAVTVFELLNLVGLLDGTLFLRFLISLVTGAWASFAAIRILGSTTPAEKRYMVLGPVVIFYLLTSLLILYHAR